MKIQLFVIIMFKKFEEVVISKKKRKKKRNYIRQKGDISEFYYILYMYDFY